MVGDDAVEKDAEMRVTYRFELRRQFAPHLVDGPGRRQHAVLFAETLEAVLSGVDAANMGDGQLLLPLECRGPCLNAHKLASLELLLEAFDVVEELGRDLTGRVLQRKQQQLAI